MSDIELLPTDARKKLVALEAARMDAEDAAQAAGRRLQALPRSTDPAIGEALQTKRDLNSAKQEELSMLLNWIYQFLRSNKGVLEAAATTQQPRLEKDETIPSALKRIRLNVVSTKVAMVTVRNSPIPLADARQAIAKRVARMADNGAPHNFDLTAGKLTLTWGTPDFFTGDRAASMMAWLWPEQMTQRLCAELVEPEGGEITAEAKQVRLGELATHLDQLERDEEALIEAAGRDGLDIARRADASPVAVLGIVVTTAAQAQAAAA